MRVIEDRDCGDEHPVVQKGMPNNGNGARVRAWYRIGFGRKQIAGWLGISVTAVGWLLNPETTNARSRRQSDKRRRSQGAAMNTCGQCGGRGHNRRSCHLQQRAT